MSPLELLRTESFYPYIYPVGGLILGVVTLLIYVLRKDLRTIIAWMAFILIPFAPLAEYLFFKDYWFPPDFFDFYIGPMRVISGDIIMVITTPALFVVALPFFANLTIVNLDRVNYKSLAIKIFLTQGVVTVLYFALWYITGLNSIYCYTLACTILSIAILLKLQRRSFFTLYPLAVLGMGFATFFFYLMYQLIIGDNYLKAVWLLDHSKFTIEVLHTLIPLTEVLFGAFVAPFYFFLIFFLEPGLKLVHRSKVGNKSNLVT